MNYVIATAMMLMALLFGLLAHPAIGQDLPVGVTLKGDTYHVKRSALRRFKPERIKSYRALAKEYEIKYIIVK